MKETRLKQITDGLWYAEDDLFMGGILHFRCRMTIVRLSSGALWIHSPIHIDDALAKEIEDIGSVEYLVAPSKLHYLFMKDAMQRYPNASSFAAPGLQDKRQDLTFDEVLTDQPPDSWQEDFQQHIIQGAPDVNEVIFLHKASQSLIVTDLIFNIHSCKNWISPWIFRMVGVYKKTAQSRLWRQFVKDKEPARKSLQHILEWDFTRLIMAHGELVETGGQQALAQATTWMQSR